MLLLFKVNSLGKLALLLYHMKVLGSNLMVTLAFLCGVRIFFYITFVCVCVFIYIHREKTLLFSFF